MVSQICKHDGKGARRFLKRRTAKAIRKAGKRLLDNAPRRITKGWWT